MDFLHKSLSNKRILLGVSGGIAAYKSAELIRLLRQNGAQVRVVMTEAAQQFITAISLQALSGEAVRSNSFDAAAEAAMGHIELARWADALLIAPATADLIVRLSQGQADDLLSTLALATQSPAVLCPAMNSVMWQQASTQAALETLQQRDWQIVAPTSGDLACGEVGVGRLAELPEIVASLAQLFAPQSLAGVRLAVSAAASREYLDPVRYLSNASSGKMGYAIATAAVEAGAQTTLLSGLVLSQFLNVYTSLSLSLALKTWIFNYSSAKTSWIYLSPAQLLLITAPPALAPASQVSKSKSNWIWWRLWIRWLTLAAVGARGNW